MEMNMFAWLENWYTSQCDGGWEHSYGIKIETLDNPGWLVKIDLIDTDVNSKDIQRVLIEFDKNKWVSYKVKDGSFNAYGSPLALDILIKIFKLLVDYGEIDENKVQEYIEESKPDKFNDV
jgi:hypothetical protein